MFKVKISNIFYKIVYTQLGTVQVINYSYFIFTNNKIVYLRKNKNKIIKCYTILP